MQKQTRLMSFYESVVNIAIGYSVALSSQLIVFPLLGIIITIQTHALIGVIFTLISLVRSYVLRRVFEWLRVEKGFNFGKT